MIGYPIGRQTSLEVCDSELEVNTGAKAANGRQGAHPGSSCQEKAAK